MIHVSMTIGDHCDMEITGHANYAERGKDIVCAAASMLAQTVAKRLEDMGVSNERDMKPGYVRIVCRKADENVQNLFEFAKAGYQLLAQRCPEYVVLTQ